LFNSKLNGQKLRYNTPCTVTYFNNFFQTKKLVSLHTISLFGPYYKSKLELKSNSSEILPVNCNCNFICVRIFFVESQTYSELAKFR